ncbi:nuclear transport factor 2 family protein [Orrella daihaiensis]|uniref:Nuclear transport factor 2 family protein n=1 Tax=Orrella daihaiensis TaxID=2782176 RepID=A0ABY4AHH9_9BURK|nr:nuclear transport factor 2 family protein [Orrella daihaiensis]UOD49746.1 nuclear transport factor 2 family protein [Orrella daihaiensis]
MTSPLPKITAWFESLTPETLQSIGEIYASNAHFKDPFNDVVGVDKIRTVYAHMFENLAGARFEITHVIEQSSKRTEPLQLDPVDAGRSAFVAWQFKFEWRGQAFDIPGGTRFEIDDRGLVTDHVDYWDVAASLYERLPLVGSVLRLLRRRMAAVPK